MSTPISIIQKQLLIQSLFDSKNCRDLQNDICEYLFIDNIQVSARKNKKKLIEGLNTYLERISDNTDPHWYIGYGFELQFQCIQCLECGGFKLSGVLNFDKIASRALCSCPGFHEYYEQYIIHLNQPLQIFM